LLFLDAIATTAKAKNSSSGYRPPGRYSHVLYPQILLQTHKYLSLVQKGAGWTERVRSVSMNTYSGDSTSSDSSGFNLWRGFQKISDLRSPGPADIFIFLDEHPDSINDGVYFPILSGYGGLYGWCDIPANYHNGACGFAFADGHSTIKRWLGKLRSPQWVGVTYTDRHAGVLQCTSSEDKNDIDWVKQRMADPVH
jgi:prepilin-type processing-associated H-X9-DG protein